MIRTLNEGRAQAAHTPIEKVLLTMGYRSWEHPKTGETRYYAPNNLKEQVIGLTGGRPSKSSGHRSGFELRGLAISNTQGNRLAGQVAAHKAYVIVTSDTEWDLFCDDTTLAQALDAHLTQAVAAYLNAPTEWLESWKR